MGGALRATIAALAIALTAVPLVPGPAAAAEPVLPAEILAWDGYNPAGQVDANGHTHVGFLRFTEGGLWYGSDLSGTWTMTRISSLDGFKEPRLALDGAGKVHVAVGNEGSVPGIYYLTDKSGRWQVVRLTKYAADRGPAIAVDSDGAAHVVIAEVEPEPNVDEERNYYTNRRGHWTSLPLPACGRISSIALDASRRVHIACDAGASGAPDHGIFHLTDANGSWVVERVATGGYAHPLISIGGGRIRIAFESVNPAAIHLSTRQGAGWTTPTKVEATLSDLSSFVVDEHGASHIVYGGRYATNASGSWVRRDIPISGTIAFDGTGARFVVGGTMTIGRAALDGPTWSRSTLGSGGLDTTDPSNAVDGSGVSHVAYHLPWSGTWGIRYARLVDGVWSVKLIRTSASAMGLDPSIAVRPDGIAYVAYIDRGGTELWLGSNAAGSWSWAKLGTALAYACPQLAVGPGGSVSIAVRRDTDSGGFLTQRVVLVSNRSGSFTTKVLPGASDPGCPGIAMDPAGTAHVTYTWDGRAGYVSVTASGAVTTMKYGMSGDVRPQIAVDADGHVYIAYIRPGDYHSPDGGLYLRTDRSGAWITRHVAGAVSDESDPAIAVAADGTVAIAYGGFLWARGVFVAAERDGRWSAFRVLGDSPRTVDVATTPTGQIRVVHSQDARGAVHLSQ